MDPNELGRAAEVAKVLHCTESGLAQMRYKGTGPKFIKVGRRVLYRRRDLDSFIVAGEREPESARAHAA